YTTYRKCICIDGKRCSLFGACTYFLPLMLADSAAKKFNYNIYLALWLFWDRLDMLWQGRPDPAGGFY
ncbi:MAG: hypothetical protein ACI4F3_10475, partial [Enterocloster sp.]